MDKAEKMGFGKGRRFIVDWHNQPQNVITGPMGAISIDLTSMPVNPPVAAQPGDTWNFQCWYRDVANTNNFTDAVSILFQ